MLRPWAQHLAKDGERGLGVQVYWQGVLDGYSVMLIQGKEAHNG